MSFLFDKKNQKAFRWVWVVFASLIVLSMVVTLFAYGQGGY